MSEWVRSERLDVRGMILLRHGELVLEWYAGGVRREHNHNIYSVTKSVVGTLTGIAIKEGKLSGADATLGELFPDSEAVAKNSRKAGVTVGDLLTMRSGFRCARANKAAGSERELFDQIHGAADRSRFILRLDMLGDPGVKFAYGNAEPQVMLSVLERAYRKKALPLAGKLLFGPLEFSNARWRFPDKSGSVPGGYGLRLRVIDLAKLGLLYLQQGKWKGSQLVPAGWIRESTRDQTGSGYGYYWWTGQGTGEKSGFAAKGVRGQRIFVDPGQDIVFVVTADLPPKRVREVLKKLTERFVLAAMETDEPLPGNPDQVAKLRRELEIASRYVPEHRNGLPPARLPQIPSSPPSLGD